jgi:uncharacterized membrane protein YfcA
MKFTAIILILWAALVTILVNSRTQHVWLIIAMATITCGYLAVLYIGQRLLRQMPHTLRNIVYAVTVLFAAVDLWICVLLFTRP